MGLAPSELDVVSVAVTRLDLIVTCVMETQVNVPADQESLDWSVTNVSLYIMDSPRQDVNNVDVIQQDPSVNSVTSAQDIAG